MTGEATAPTLAVQVARLFFDRQLSKVEIAARLGISRFRVARLIDQALADGLVRIEFNDVPGQRRGLARQLEERWGLDLCVVASEQEAGPGPAPLARLSAQVLDDLVRPGDTLGIAGDLILVDVVGSVAPRVDPSIRVVPLAGISARLAPGRDAGEIARRLAERWGAACERLPAPAFVASESLRDALLREPGVAGMTTRYAHLSLVLTGIQAMGAAGRPNATEEPTAIAPEDAREIVARGGVGAIALHAFDAAGRFLEPPCSARMLGISVEQLRHASRVVAVAAGSEKAAAIVGALATGVVTVLVTDQAAAERIAEMSGRGRAEPGSPQATTRLGEETAERTPPGTTDVLPAVRSTGGGRATPEHLSGPGDRVPSTGGTGAKVEPGASSTGPASTSHRPAREWRW